MAGASCLTPADQWLSKNLSPREKGDLLADRADASLARLTQTGDLTLVANLKSLYGLVQTADPAGTRGTEGLAKLNAYLDQRRTEGQTAVKVLATKASLSDKEKYTLVVLVRQLELLAAPGVDLQKLRDQTAPIRAEVLKTTAASLVNAEKALGAVKSDDALPRAVGGVAAAIDAQQAVDPGADAAGQAATRLKAFLAKRLSTDLAKASAQTKAQDWAGAVRTLDAARAIQDAGRQPDQPALDEVAYTAQLAWARQLFEAKKFAEAALRVSAALNLKAAPEALELREKINQAASARDWDAEYDATDKQIDAMIKAGDLRSAWNLVLAATPRLKKDEPKARLANRRKQVTDAAHDLYEKAVNSYNDEDYAEARSSLETVATIDPAWKLTRAYLDKARSKLQVLGTP